MEIQEEHDKGKQPITKTLFEEYDVDILDQKRSGTLLVVQRGEYGFIEWNPFENYDVNTHMSFDEWGVIAHDSNTIDNVAISPIQLAISAIDEIKQDVGSNGRPCVIITITEKKQLPIIYFPKSESVARFIQSLKRYLCFIRRNNVYAVDHSKAALRNVMKEFDLGTPTSQSSRQKKVYDFQDVYDVTLSGLSKVTNFLKGGLSSRPQSSSRPTASDLPLSMGKQTQASLDRAFTHPEHLSHRPAESDFELYDVRKPLARSAPVSRDNPVTRTEWESHLDLDGRIHRVKELQDRIFWGGIEPELRRDIWPFLLNVFSWDTTVAERSQVMTEKAEAYKTMKSQWKSILPCQITRYSLFKDRAALVEKDCLRTDRVLNFYKGDENDNIKVLYDILMTYCQYNFDLGYVQGMSDLLSPLHMLFEDEELSFWLFAGYMDMVEQHFFMDQQKTQEKLSDVSSLICYCDSELYNHLEKEDSANFFFCFRWLLINFKREFKTNDILYLWEVLWTCPYNTDYSLFIAVAILLQERDAIIKNNMNFSDLIKYINNLSGRLDLNSILGQAESLYHNIRSQPDLPFNLRTNILRMPTDSPMSSLGSYGRPHVPGPCAPAPPFTGADSFNVQIQGEEKTIVDGEESDGSSVEQIPEDEEVDGLPPQDPASMLAQNIRNQL